MRGLITLLVLAPAAALANGTVSGTVRAEHPPQLPAIKIAKDATVCGAEAARDALVIGPEGALANVVVSIKGVKAEKAPPPVAGAAVDQVGCRYTPHVQAVTVGTALQVLNNDAVLHNVHGTLETGASPMTVFNVAMPFKGGRSPQVLKRAGAIKLRCDAGHTWMNAYVHVFDHPYYAVTDSKGRFTIKDLPPGKYTVEFWHEPLGEKQAPVTRTATVEVTDGKTSAADAALTF
jgi:plastocyanin